MTCADFVRLVDPYTDAELESSAVMKLEAHLAGCRSCQQVLAERLALGRLVRNLPYHTAPARVREAALDVARRGTAGAGLRERAGFARPGMPTRRWLAAAAVVMAASIGGAGIQMTRVHNAALAMAAAETSLVDAHVASIGSGHLYDVLSSDQHTVKPWFLGKIDFAPPVEDLAPAGFPLEGGRVAHLDGRDAAVLIYRRRLHPISVFIAPALARDRRDDARSIRGFGVRHWVARDMAFWVVSDINDDDLAAFVAALRK